MPTTNKPNPFSAPRQLRCEHMEDPLGIDERTPRLSWRLAPPRSGRGAFQSARQIVVTSGGEPLWDSGKVASSDNVLVPYDGPRLQSRQRCAWRVRVWDERDRASAWSAPATWEMGLLSPADWQADWIGSASDGESPGFFRHEFRARGPVTRARLYATALGLYECWINGRRVGDRLFTPGWTDYRLRVPYQTYDVTGLLNDGGNALGAILADGWYRGFVQQVNDHKGPPLYGPVPLLRVQLVVDFADGSSGTIGSGDSWRTAPGPFLAASIFNGETYDARLELPGWSEPGFDASSWHAVQTGAPLADPVIEAAVAPPVRRHEELPAQSVTEPAPGVFILDLGQNFSGWARLRVQGSRGQTVTLRHGEMLNADGTLYTENLRSAKATDRYTLRGGDEEIHEPRFTFHGFRYVEVTGYPGRPDKTAITGIVVHSDIPPIGTFACSDPMLNQLQHNIVWGQKSNFLEAPTDCPQRNERLGWTGDAQVFIRTAAFNRDVAAFFTKWLRDLADAQADSGTFPCVAPNVLGAWGDDGGAGWSDAATICPWELYQATGDTRPMERLYPALLRFVAYMDRTDPRQRRAFGDWLNHNDPTANDLLSVAFHAHSVSLLARMAVVLGKRQDARRLERRRAALEAQFAAEFVTPNGRMASGSQTAYVLALHFGLLPEKQRTNAVARLVAHIRSRGDHLATGFLGTPYLLDVLRDNGHLGLAYTLLLKDDFPSWGYPIRQGATTMWERWDSWHHERGFQSTGMNSFNHYAYGAVGAWMYHVIAGIESDPEAPGYRRVIVRPQPGGGLTWARASLITPQGKLAVAWRCRGTRMTLDVSIPPNTHATVYLPGQRAVRVGPGRWKQTATLPRKEA